MPIFTTSVRWADSELGRGVWPGSLAVSTTRGGRPWLAGSLAKKAPLLSPVSPLWQGEGGVLSTSARVSR